MGGMIQTEKVKNNATYYDKTQHAHFGGKPSFQAMKKHLTVKQ